jgi:FkbM family methyltransferase
MAWRKQLITTPLGWLGLEISRIQHDRNPLRVAHAILDSPTKAVLFDVGANLGQSVEQFTRQFAYPQIHVFEPSPKIFAELCKRVGKSPAVALNNLALGSEPGSAQFFENSQSEMSSFLQPGADHWGAIAHSIDVPVQTLDGYCSERQIDHIDLLKIDTQGFDLEVLRGANNMLAAKSIAIILVEIMFLEIYQSAPRCDEIFKFLFDRDYRLVALYNQVYRRGALAWADAMFVAD